MERTSKRSNKWLIGAMALFLCALLLLGISFLSGEQAFASGTEEVEQTLTVSDCVVNRGQEFDVDISIANNGTGMHSLRLLVTYNTSAMTLVGYTAKDPMEDAAGLYNNWKGSLLAAGKSTVTNGYEAYGTQKNPFVLFWDNTDKLYGNGKIVTLTFASNKDAEIDSIKKEKDYAVSVAVDAANTMMTYGKTCSPDVTGGLVKMRYGVYRVVLLNAEGGIYHSMDDSYNPSISIQDVLDEKNTGIPQKADDEDGRYTYEFVSWREVLSENDGKWLTYKPTYRAIPKEYTLTFHQGIWKSGADGINYEDADLTAYLGAGYSYRDAEVTIPYGTIIVFDDYKPTVDYNRHPDYTFRGWYTDIECTQPVDFATMPSSNKTLYGYYKYTAYPDDVTTTKFEVETSIEDGYIIATLSVKENFGFNTLLFDLDYDADLLDFVGFLYETDSEFYDVLNPTFPVINSTIEGHGAIKNVWQEVEGGYTIAGKHFYFENVGSEVYAPQDDDAVYALVSSSYFKETGKLITFKFAPKADAAGEAEIGITIADKGITRYHADGSTWYTNATVITANPSVIRVEKPTATTETYTYDGTYQHYEFASEGGSAYYAVVNSSRKDAGEYDVEIAGNEKEAVRVVLLGVENAIVTWEDGTTDTLYFPFVIEKKQIVKPSETTETYTYRNGDEIEYVFASELALNDYAVSNDTRKNAGSYTVKDNDESPLVAVKVALKDTANTEWKDGTVAPLYFDFVISPMEVTAPTASTASYTYANGDEIEYLFASAGDSTYYNRYNYLHTNAGNYNVTNDDDSPLAAVKVVLKDAANTVWKDADPGEETATLYFPFQIAKVQVTAPTASTLTYTYRNGEEIEYVFASAGDSAYYTRTHYLRTNAGNYNVTDDDDSPLAAVRASLNDTANTEWKDGSILDKTFPFEIAKRALASPSVDAKAYTGLLIKADVELTGNEPYELTENNGGVEKGSYDVKFTIKEENRGNYCWESSENETVTVAFLIVEVANEWTVTPFVVSKVYDGEPITTSAAKAKQGEVVISFRLQTAVGEPFSLGAPTNAGAYTVKFEVVATESYSGLSKTIDFDIYKVQLTAPTATVKSYVYTGSEQTYEFANSGDTERYNLTGATRTAAGSQTVTAAIKDKVNYVWKDNTVTDKTFTFTIAKAKVEKPTVTAKTYVYTGSEQSYEFATLGDSLRYDVLNGARTNAGEQTVYASLKDSDNYCWSDESVADLAFSFVIAKKQLTIPLADTERSYIYNGEEQTFIFTVKGDTDKYSLSGDKKKDAGNYTVTASINDKLNYEWTDGSVLDKTYPFLIRYASLTASTEGAEIISVTANAPRTGFAWDSVLSLAKANPDLAALIDYIASCDKVGALSQLTAEQAAAMVNGKCVAASLIMSVTPDAGVGEYDLEITLPSLRTGVVVARIVGQTIEVFDTALTDGNVISLSTDRIGALLILADHVFDKEVAEARFLKSAATCEEAAVYYKSCECGMSSKDNGDETFVSGNPLGHDYDLTDIEWIWSADHRTATARLTCLRDAGHVLDLPAEVMIIDQKAPKKDESGYVDRTASIRVNGVIYSGNDREILPANGHVYTDDPVWIWKKGTDNYLVKALFTCECGESTLEEAATVTYLVSTDKITYTAEVIFNGVIYRDIFELKPRPAVIFDFNDRNASEMSVSMLPGEKVNFLYPEAQLNALIAARTDYTFMGWRDENGSLVIKTDGAYLEYFIGFETVTFTAEWKNSAKVDVSVIDTAGDPIEGATVSLYNGEERVFTADTSANGTITFNKVTYGNYKIVVEYLLEPGVVITRSDGLDVDESEVHAELRLPGIKFNTFVEGDGSAEGLEDAISEEEKASIKDGTAGGTINKIVITQKRVQDVPEEIKKEILAKVRKDDQTGNAKISDFYDVTIVKTTTARNLAGVTYVMEENIKVAEKYQTNVFPISANLRADLLAVSGNAENIIVYKRHMYDTGVVAIYALPKVSERDGEKADFECYYIKHVAGEEYIAIRQKEYSVLALGVSPDPVLLTNEITSLTLADRTFGDAAGTPILSARYGAPTAIYTYSDAKDGEFSAVAPTAAGTYYLKAFIPATDVYAAAEKIVPFTISRKMIARPSADQTTFTYNGEAQTYTIAASDEYVVTGNVQTNAGTYSVTVALADPANTVWDSGRDEALSFDFVIEKKKLRDIPGIEFKNKSFWFNGKRHSIYITGELPEGVEVIYSGNNEYDLGKFTVTATFTVSNENYDVSEPMTAVMSIRLNWIPIVILIVIVLVILIVVLVIVEKLLKKLKKGEAPPPEEKGSDDEEAAAKEGANND